MMGKSHRSMGVAFGWTAALSGDLAFNWSVPVAFMVGAALSLLGSVAVMWADLDHASSTATHRYGVLSELFSEDIRDLAAWVFDRTATELDHKDPNCHRLRIHRGFTHSAIVAWGFGLVLAAIAASVTAWFHGPWLMVGGLVWVGLGGGAATHGFGDLWTNHGCAYLWPIKVRGRRFYPVRVPRWFRMSTGQGVEPWLVPILSGIAAVSAGIGLVPGAWPAIIAGLLDLANQAHA